jgi:hypothetical protein
LEGFEPFDVLDPFEVMEVVDLSSSSFEKEPFNSTIPWPLFASSLFGAVSLVSLFASEFLLLARFLPLLFLVNLTVPFGCSFPLGISAGGPMV